MCEGLQKIIDDEKNALQKIINSKDDVLAEKDAEIAELKRQLEALRA